jgi:hypothetical protein
MTKTRARFCGSLSAAARAASRQLRIKGRQYFVVSTSATGGRGGGGAAGRGGAAQPPQLDPECANRRDRLALPKK